MLLEQFQKAAQKKSNTSKYQFWRHDNKPIELWINKVVFEKLHYIHNNFVDEGVVFKPEDYLYSLCPKTPNSAYSRLIIGHLHT
ncbi:MAG: hypothetical protein ACOCWB_07525 [Bacteroidota bacterium]